MSFVQDYPLAAKGQPDSHCPFASGPRHKLILNIVTLYKSQGVADPEVLLASAAWYGLPHLIPGGG